MRKILIVFVLALLPFQLRAQFVVDRLVRSGEIALHYEDYVLSIQYFNQVIALKPYLYRPWQLRGIAKFYLDDFSGAEKDAAEAIRLNPYIDGLYDLRAISRIRQKNYGDAIDDYTKALQLNPSNQGYWFNRALCRLNQKDYDQALLDVDSIIDKWKAYSNAYSLKAELYLHKEDTTEAVRWLDKSLELNAYDADAWTTRGYISISRKQWKEADGFLSKAIHLKPKTVGNYVNRALVRYNYNNLSGAMADYDMAIDLDPNNFLAHYNRGQLRMLLGDDNRAIDDFDFVIALEPDNFIAIFNRALLHDRVGDLRSAINDYTTVINQFPNFWTGLHYRARCYRRLGMTAKAEMDEFRILKAQMNKHLGIQPRWSKGKTSEVRKRSEVDMDKYNQLVVDDEETVERDYQSEYRGRVQNRSVESDFMPMFMLSYFQYSSGVKTYQIYDHEVDRFNQTAHPERPIYLACATKPLTEEQSTDFFQFIAKLSTEIDQTNAMAQAQSLLMSRAVAYTVTQDFDAAINDLTAYLQADSVSVLALMQRAAVQAAITHFSESKGLDTQLLVAQTQSDMDRALALAPTNAFLYYNRANLKVQLHRYVEAIDDYTEAINLNPSLAEAYYNRGLARMQNNDKVQAIDDLSKAGELGLYRAYSLIKRFQK